MGNLSLKDFRKLASLSQQAVADFLGIKVNTYALKEQGKRQFTIAEYKGMKELFNIAIVRKGITLQHEITIDDLVG